MFFVFILFSFKRHIEDGVIGLIRQIGLIGPILMVEKFCFQHYFCNVCRWRGIGEKDTEVVRLRRK
jgi:hypothetical protein